VFNKGTSMSKQKQTPKKQESDPIQRKLSLKDYRKTAKRCKEIQFILNLLAHILDSPDPKAKIVELFKKLSIPPDSSTTNEQIINWTLDAYETLDELDVIFLDFFV
jgi:hypothetical protein